MEPVKMVDAYKIGAILLVLVLIINMVVRGMGLIGDAIFWGIIILAAIITYTIKRLKK